MTTRARCCRTVLILSVCAQLSGAAFAQDEAGCVSGTPDAPIRLEVFSDYECPACRAFYLQTMKLVFANYADKGKVCVVYREFPSFPHSREAARFARAALRVGVEQWRSVSDALFESQPRWSQSGDLESVVSSALDAKDMRALREHLKSPSLDEGIDKDAVLGLEMGVDSTPTSFLTAHGTTEKIAAAVTYAAMQRRFDALLGAGPGARQAAVTPGAIHSPGPHR